MSPRTLTVLVADDAPLVRQRLCQLIGEQAGIRIVGEAASALETLRLFESLRPDVIVLDIHLPDATGLEVLRRVKAAAPWCVVIMLTNFQERVFQEISQILGADHFFQKATEFEKVVDVLCRLAVGDPRPRPQPAEGQGGPSAAPSNGSAPPGKPPGADSKEPGPSNP